MRVAFCVSGRGSLFRAAVANATAIGIQPVLLVMEAKSSQDLDDFASIHAVPHIRIQRSAGEAFDRELTRVIGTSGADLVALTFDRILPSDLVASFEGRIINVHPALLPAFAGMHGIERTVESGVRFGGATIHEVVDEVDGGQVIAQAVLPTVPGESVEEYGRRMYGLLEPMFMEVLRWYANGDISHDAAGHVVVRGAKYGTLPVSPMRNR